MIFFLYNFARKKIVTTVVPPPATVHYHRGYSRAVVVHYIIIIIIIIITMLPYCTTVGGRLEGEQIFHEKTAKLMKKKYIRKKQQ